MSFDAIEPHYRWLEWITAGSLLQRCRPAFIEELAGARHVLLLGEGRGRFLIELMRLNSAARITCVDASERMLEAMRHAVRDQRLPESRVRFVHADVLSSEAGALPAMAPRVPPYDAVVSHFFLDCFRPEQLGKVVASVGGCTTPGARWLLSDFRVPESGWRRIRARIILAGLYAFFRVTTRLPARKLTQPDLLMRGAGFELKQRRFFNFGLLHSDVWQR